MLPLNSSTRSIRRNSRFGKCADSASDPLPPLLSRMEGREEGAAPPPRAEAPTGRILRNPQKLLYFRSGERAFARPPVLEDELNPETQCPAGPGSFHFQGDAKGQKPHWRHLRS
jgi:hypothetical protein